MDSIFGETKNESQLHSKKKNQQGSLKSGKGKRVSEDNDDHVFRMLRGRYNLNASRLAKCSKQIIDDVRRFHRDPSYTSKTLHAFKRFYQKHFDNESLESIQTKLNDSYSIPPSFLDNHFDGFFHVT